MMGGGRVAEKGRRRLCASFAVGWGVVMVVGEKEKGKKGVFEVVLRA
jgi:hypothetical protein